MEKPFFTKTLGPISAQLIDILEKRGNTLFTLGEASAVYGHNRSKTSTFLSTLVKRGLLTRIKSGSYLILRRGQENAQLTNWPIIARELASPHDYFISHYSAMRLHGMTTHPLFDVYITLSKRRRAQQIGNMTYHFLYIKPEHFWGSEFYWATKQDKVYVSNIERTLLDGLERPDLCGGIKEVARGIWVKQKEIDWEKMTQYAKHFHKKAAIKRLGFILDLLNLGIHCEHLVEFISSAKDYIFLDPNGPQEGKYLSRWHIKLNMNIEELKTSVWG